MQEVVHLPILVEIKSMIYHRLAQSQQDKK